MAMRSNHELGVPGGRLPATLSTVAMTAPVVVAGGVTGGIMGGVTKIGGGVTVPVPVPVTVAVLVPVAVPVAGGAVPVTGRVMWPPPLAPDDVAPDPEAWPPVFVTPRRCDWGDRTAVPLVGDPDVDVGEAAWSLGGAGRTNVAPAVGTRFAIGLATKLRTLDEPPGSDAVVFASSNTTTATELSKTGSNRAAPTASREPERRPPGPSTMGASPGLPASYVEITSSTPHTMPFVEIRCT